MKKAERDRNTYKNWGRKAESSKERQGLLIQPSQKTAWLYEDNKVYAQYYIIPVTVVGA